MGFAKLMAGAYGRVARIAAGLVMVGVGIYLQNVWGFVVAAIGLVPLTAGVFNFCVFAPIFGGPFNGRSLVYKA